MMVDLSPFSTQGHLHDLGLDAYLDGALSEAVMAEVDAHLTECGDCTERVELARSEAALPLPALKLGSAVVDDAPPVPDAANRPWRAWLAPATAIAAAFLGFVAMPTAPTDHTDPLIDTLRSKSANNPIRLEVWADRGERSSAVHDGSKTLDSDRLGFRIQNRDEGHVMIVGIDDAGEPWQGYPEAGHGSAETSVHSQAADIGAAVQLDGRPGRERIVALWCPDAYSFDEISHQLVGLAQATDPMEKLPTIREGCEQSEVRVKKVKQR